MSILVATIASQFGQGSIGGLFFVQDLLQQIRRGAVTKLIGPVAQGAVRRHLVVLYLLHGDD